MRMESTTTTTTTGKKKKGCLEGSLKQKPLFVVTAWSSMVLLLGWEWLAPGCQGFCLPTTSSALYKERLRLEREENCPGP